MSEPVNTLDVWLGIATDKLTQAGKERITLEITSHFDDAVASYRANGLTDADARARALVDLGDARKAARRFRKRHLTQSEAEFIESKLKHYRKWHKPWTQGLFWIILGCLYYVVRREPASRLLLVICALSFVAQSFSVSLANRRGFLSYLRSLLALDILTELSLIIFWGFSIAWFDGVILSLVSSWRWFREFRLWFKLGKLADNGQEMRPPGAIAS